MKQSEIKVGGKYTAKVSGKIVTVRVDEIREVSERRGSGLFARWENGTRYDVTNMATGRRTTFRSAAKFRSAVAPKAQTPRLTAYGLLLRALRDAPEAIDTLRHAYKHIKTTADNPA